MSIEIYPSDFSTRYELTHAISIQMSIYYNDTGKVIITAPVDDYNITALAVGNIIYDTEKNETYCICNTRHDTETNRITANGYTCDWLLNSRCIREKIHVTGVEHGIYQAVDDNLRGLSRISVAQSEGLSEQTDFDLYGGQVLDEITPVLQEAGLGRKMIWDPDNLSWTFKIFKGQDLTDGIHAVVFSEEHGTARQLVIDDDDSTLKNFAYAIGKKTVNNQDVEVIKEVGDATGDVRREIWLDTNITKDAGDTDAQFESKIVSAAQIELAQRIRRKSFSVSIDPADLGRIYNVGDIVSCVSIRFGVSFSARITGVQFKMDNRSTSTQVLLGDPILTALGAMKLGTN